MTEGQTDHNVLAVREVRYWNWGRGQGQGRGKDLGSRWTPGYGGIPDTPDGGH